MEFSDRLGIAALVMCFIGLGITILWPTKRWVGWISLSIGLVLGLWWGVTEWNIRHRPIKEAKESRPKGEPRPNVAQRQASELHLAPNLQLAEDGLMQPAQNVGKVWSPTSPAHAPYYAVFISVTDANTNRPIKDATGIRAQVSFSVDGNKGPSYLAPWEGEPSLTVDIPVGYAKNIIVLASLVTAVGPVNWDFVGPASGYGTGVAPFVDDKHKPRMKVELLSNQGLVLASRIYTWRIFELPTGRTAIRVTKLRPELLQ